MNLKQDLHFAYVLHTRSFRETSLLVEILSSEHGRVAAVARGAKRGKTKSSSILQPFMALQLSWHGNGDLVTLTNAEILKFNTALRGRSAICGLYLNELLIKLLPKWDHCEDLFNSYQYSLANLATGVISEQVLLRKFELQLLKSLGYGLQLRLDIDTGAAIISDRYYLFDPVLGPKQTNSSSVHAFKGASLIAFADEKFGEFSDPAVLLDLKRLMRLVLRYHLGTRQIVSRELL